VAATKAATASPASIARMSDPPRNAFPEMITERRMKTLLRAGVGTSRICAGRSGGRAPAGRRGGGAFARGFRRWARPDAKFDAVAVAIPVLPEPLVIDAAPALDGVVRVAPANVAAVRLPHAAHDHPGAGENGGAVGQMDGAQRFAGERSGGRRAAQRHADQFAAEFVD